ncbi:hypothetical protein GYMLUDRAFT_37254 [Collybiopsis luxurians FD-317 M1]|nr:hypothetical protein GYMLUDRAFT_37254 [Collybiopsis luxurians FD-317 M1]
MDTLAPSKSLLSILVYFPVCVCWRAISPNSVLFSGLCTRLLCILSPTGLLQLVRGSGGNLMALFLHPLNLQLQSPLPDLLLVLVLIPLLHLLPPHQLLPRNVMRTYPNKHKQPHSLSNNNPETPNLETKINSL